MYDGHRSPIITFLASFHIFHVVAKCYGTKPLPLRTRRMSVDTSCPWLVQWLTKSVFQPLLYSVASPRVQASFSKLMQTSTEADRGQIHGRSMAHRAMRPDHWKGHPMQQLRNGALEDQPGGFEDSLRDGSWHPYPCRCENDQKVSKSIYKVSVYIYSIYFFGYLSICLAIHLLYIIYSSIYSFIYLCIYLMFYLYYTYCSYVCIYIYMQIHVICAYQINSNCFVRWSTALPVPLEEHVEALRWTGGACT